ncbi:MAG TPA: tetratricopeptide repeat protein, partial [Gallicola sp.]|nr:tetratricopeptide repeat protein [Gallicola sp.]
GLLFYHKKEFDIAIKYFKESIKNDYIEFSTIASTTYLLSCYLSVNDIEGIKEIINMLPEEEIDYIDFSFKLFCEDIAEQCYRKIIRLEIEEMIIAKTKGFLASLILSNKLPDFINYHRRKLTDKEAQLLSEAKALIKSSIEYHSSNVFFLCVYSDILYCEGKFDESFIVQLEFLKKSRNYKDLEIFPNVSLEDCTDDFINNYPGKLNELFYNDNEFEDFYIKEKLSNDIEHLFKLKAYSVIVDLYFILKSNSNILKIDSLFEIAYSLKEMDHINEAILIYEKSIDIDGGSSSVYNNLAIIYEEKKDIKKAVELIKRAKKTNKNDLIIEGNYRRIVEDIFQNKQNKANINNNKKSRLSFNNELSRITYGKRFCQIPINTYEYYLCKTIFEKPLRAKIPEEEILEVLDRAKLEEKKRTIYDTCIRINRKVEKSIGLQKILINRGSMVWIREDFTE